MQDRGEGSGGWPVLVSIQFNNGEDHVIASWYSGLEVESLVCMFVKRGHETLDIQPKWMQGPWIKSCSKEDLIEAYLDLLEGEGKISRYFGPQV